VSRRSRHCCPPDHISRSAIGDQDLQQMVGSPTNGETIWQRKEVDPAHQNGNIKTNKTDTKTALHVDVDSRKQKLSREMSVYAPDKQNRTEKRKDRKEPSLKAVVGRCVLGELGGSPRKERNQRRRAESNRFWRREELDAGSRSCSREWRQRRGILRRDQGIPNTRGRERCGRFGERADCLCG